MLTGAPRPTHLLPKGGVGGVTPGVNYALEVGILSNPYPVLTPESWKFTDYNGTVHDVLPDNVHMTVQSSTSRLTLLAKLYIIDTNINNYGNYVLTAENPFGNMTPVVLGILPEGDLLYVCYMSANIRICHSVYFHST